MGVGAFVGFCLNAPSGAGCFLTKEATRGQPEQFRLNAPSGAECFLVMNASISGYFGIVLMHFVVLDAF